MMKVFVAGATGQTGRRIVNELVKREIPVRALVRNLDLAREILPNQVEMVMGDVLNPDSLRSAIDDSTVIICATGATPSLDFTAFYRVDYEGSKNLIKIAKEKQIEHFVFVTSLCVSRFFHPLNLFGLVLFWKKQAEKYLIASGLNYTIVRPGGLKNEDNLDPVVMGSADTLFEGSIPRIKVAQVCVEALFNPNAQQKILEIVTNPSAENKTFDRLLLDVSAT
jgi:uncharacterized protein YbjT (DUF2867 family)